METKNHPTFRPHTLSFEGSSNFRELGGYPAADGRRVKYGVFYRSGTLYDMQSSADRELLRSLRLKLIVDLRSAGERSVNPDYIPDGAEYLPLSAMRYDNGDEVDFSPKGIERLEQELKGLDGASVIEMLQGYYARMLFHNPAYQALFQAMEAGSTPMLFHCTSGKDRTGVAAMLILLALGADRETALSDYMETNRSRQAQIDELKRSRGSLIEENPEEWELLLIGVGVLPRLANAALDAIYDKYGTAEAYFEKEFGLDAQRLEALRDRYLEP